MPKADATGLAPEKSAFLEPPEAFTGSGSSLSLVSVRINISMVKPSERRPWASKRDDRPKSVPNWFLPQPAGPDKARQRTWETRPEI